MILVLLTSIMTMLYPWNFEAGTYFTAGEWTNGRTYQAQSTYIGFDRWKKDYVRANVHHQRVDDDWYEQWTTSIGALHWWKSEFKYGLDAGIVSSFGNGWFAGPRFEGVLGWVGYHASYKYLSTDEPMFIRQNSAIQYSHNTALILRRQLGPYLISAGVQGVQNEHSATTISPSIHVSGWINEWLFVNLGHGFGEARYIVSPLTNTVDLNDDFTVAWYEVQTTLRLSPHWYTHLQYTRTDYDPQTQSAWPYTAHYVTLGLNLRY